MFLDVRIEERREKISRIEKNHDIEQNPIYQHEN